MHIVFIQLHYFVRINNRNVSLTSFPPPVRIDNAILVSAHRDALHFRGEGRQSDNSKVQCFQLRDNNAHPIIKTNKFLD